MIKAVKVLNLFSTLLFAAILLMVYAFLPVSVDLNIEGVGTVHKQELFYQALIGFLAINILLRLVIFYGFRGFRPTLLAWTSSLIFVVNFYFTVLIGFIGVWNNATSISPSSYGYLNTIGPLLLIVWVVGLIFLVIKKS